MNRSPQPKLTVWIGLLCAPALAAAAQPGSKPLMLERVRVVKPEGQLGSTPGSAHHLDESDIRQQSYADVNRVLRKVPGVYVREEDGYGLFPNISLRGVDTSRSAKITIMEDGVLTAPAPYSAPSAYYSPSAGRMSGLEVLKGSSQVKYGPQTTGGVINYLSTPIPTEQRTYVRSLYGSYNELRVHAFTGNTLDTSLGKIGYLVEGYARRADGFKSIDRTPDFRNSEKTGFSNLEPMIKLSWEPNSAMYQRFEFKYGHTDRDADETYLGLSEDDFNNDPYRRYAASRFDNIDTQHDRTYLRHLIAPTDNLDILTTVYYAGFERNWFKLNDLRDIPGVGNMSLSEALAGGAGGAGLAVLKGEAPGTLRLRNNSRKYGLQGIESVAHYAFNTGALRHELAVGGRAHYDYVRRFQRDELFVQEANGTISSQDPGTPGDAGNRKQETNALATYVQDEIRYGQWTFMPGVRFEHLDYKFTDFANQSNSGSTSNNLWGGGLGVVYAWNSAWSTFGGAYRGFSPAGPSGSLNGVNEETSLGLELGTRYTDPNQALRAEVVGFLTEFDDLIVIDNIGGTGTGQTENFGEVRAYGAEVFLSYDPGIANKWAVRNPYFVSFTYTNAEQQNDAQSTDAESIFSFGEKGNKVPYIPEFQLTAGAGVETNQWGLNARIIYVDETFTSANNTSEQVDGAGNPDARFGKTDSYWLADLTGRYQVTNAVKLLAGVHNLLDKEYLVSRQPHGPRPGLPRFLYAGLEIQM